jgi:transcriptional regulator with XRE-family HTH domain
MGRRLRDLRQAASLSQEQLGQAAGVTAKYISAVENGHTNPSLLVLHALVQKGMGLPLAAFFAYDTGFAEAADELAELEALLASQPKKLRRRALHVLRALVETLR